MHHKTRRLFSVLDRRTPKVGHQRKSCGDGHCANHHEGKKEVTREHPCVALVFKVARVGGALKRERVVPFDIPTSGVLSCPNLKLVQSCIPRVLKQCCKAAQLPRYRSFLTRLPSRR